MVSSRIYKLQIPVILTSLCGLLMILEFYFHIPEGMKSTNITLRSFTTILAGAALILGNILLFISHTKKLSERRKEWYYSIIFMISFIITALLGVKSVRDPTFLWIYNSVTAPIGGTLYSLTGFYITVAAYRVFRARNWTAALLLVTAFIVFLAYIPIGAVAVPGITSISEWIMSIPNTAGYRGMFMGIALGIVGMGIRVLIGKQREHLGVREEKR